MILRLALIALAFVAKPLIADASVDLIVSVPEQRMYVFDAQGEKLASYKISTSARGLGDGRGTYATPLGRLAVAAKIGAGAAIGTVFKGGRRTGEICKPNAKGRDPIVTRILHLRGLEQQNARAFDRCIYIHGTPDERHLGKPVSYGCIRMSSSDVVALFDMVDVGTRIEITQDRVTSMFGAIVRRPTGADRVIAATSSPTPERSTTVATVPTNQSVSLAGLSAKHSRIGAPRENKPANRSSESHVRLFETSGLTVNFGGGSGEEERPR